MISSPSSTGLTSGCRRYWCVFDVTAKEEELEALEEASVAPDFWSDAEAARYNKWLAERRMERVRDWLAKHAEGIDVETRFRENDDSRQVIVRLVPVG